MSHLYHTLPNWLPQTFCLEGKHCPGVMHTLRRPSGLLGRAHWAELTVLGAPLKRGVSGCWLTFLSPFLSAARGHYLTQCVPAGWSHKPAPCVMAKSGGRAGAEGEPQLLCL